MSLRSLCLLALPLSTPMVPLAAQGARATPVIIAASIDSMAARAVRAGIAPALGVAIAMDGRIIYRHAFGNADATARVPADEHTLWYVASTSKSFTGFGVTLLAHRGHLRFDAPIATLLPGVPWHAGAHAESLTLAHFLSHTHHLSDVAVVMSAAYTGEIPESQWPSLLVLATPSGNRDLVYSNFGYNVAAMVIDRLQSEGWRRFLEENVYRPAGMHETYTRVSGLDPRRIAHPHRLLPSGRYVTDIFYKTDATMNSAGGHLATLDDLARWTIVQMDGGIIDGKRVFPAEAVALGQRLIAKQTRESAKRFAYFDREGWGAGWDLGSYEGEPMVSRFGGYHSTRSHLSFLPHRRIGVVAVSTGGLGSSLTDLLASYAYDLEAGRADATTRVEQRLGDLIQRLASARRTAATEDSTQNALRRLVLDRPVTDLVGRYTAPHYGTIVIEARDSALTYRWGAVYGAMLPESTTGQWFRLEIAGGDERLEFTRPSTGAASALTVNGIRFVREERTPEPR